MSGAKLFTKTIILFFVHTKTEQGIGFFVLWGKVFIQDDVVVTTRIQFSRYPFFSILMKKLLSYIFPLLSFLSLSCHDNGTQPPGNTLQLGKRNYIWEVDTLSYPGSFQTLMRDIWASSPKDVYVVGHNDQSGQGTMYNFDGKSWSPIHLLTVEGGTIQQGFDLSTVYGFGSKDVWAVGDHIYVNPTPPPNFLDSSMIIHFDGNAWEEAQLDKRLRYLSTIGGTSPNDIWAGGVNGSLYHFDGMQWRAFSFDTTVFLSSFSGYSSNNYYATGQRNVDFVQPLDSALYILFHFDGSNWAQIDSFQINPFENNWKFGYWLWKSPKGILFSSAYGVYTYQSDKTWHDLFISDWPLRIYGSSDENIWAVGGLSRAYQWNGQDWKRMTEVEDLNEILYSVWTNNVETFIVSNDGRQTYIIHGK